MGTTVQTTTTTPKPKPGEPGYVAPGAPAAGIPLTPGATAGGLTPTSPAPSNPAGVDRIGLATQSFENIQRARAPQDRLALQNVTSQAAGLGQLGSGQWRSALTTADNNRQLQLDTQRDDLINKATESTIQDSFRTADQDIARRGATVAEGGLALAQTGQANQVAQFTAQMGEQVASRLQQSGQFAAGLAEQVAARIQNKSMADAQLELNRMIQTGQLTVAQGQLALSQLQTTNQAAQEAARLAESTAGRVQQGTQFTAAQTAQAAQEAARLGLATTQTTNQATQFGQTLAEQTAARTQQNTQFTTQLAQQATQFGASQEQQLQIAQLADATQNRGLDLNDAQGKQQILVQMAQILGGPTGQNNTALMQQLAQMLGLPAFSPTNPASNLPTFTPTTQTNPTTNGPTPNTSGDPVVRRTV